MEHYEIGGNVKILGKKMNVRIIEDIENELELVGPIIFNPPELKYKTSMSLFTWASVRTRSEEQTEYQFVSANSYETLMYTKREMISRLREHMRRFPVYTLSKGKTLEDEVEEITRTITRNTYRGNICSMWENFFFYRGNGNDSLYSIGVADERYNFFINPGHAFGSMIYGYQINFP